jgi:hypothetical protein
MKLGSGIAVVLAIGLGIAALVTVQGQQYVDVRKARSEDRDAIELGTELSDAHDFMPAPVEPIDTASRTSREPQLVGFTEKRLTGGRGILNYTLACREQFPNSRMCTAEEINHSFHVPEPPGYGYAWVQPSLQPHGLAVPACQGWSSASSSETGLAISTGPCTQCYGGYASVTCDERRSVACCGTMDGE